jgi:hypothetical protein
VHAISPGCFRSSVDISTALSLDLQNLLRVLDHPDLDIEWSLRSLRHDLERVVPSFVGLSMTVVVEGQPVTLTSVGDEAARAEVASSLDVPLALTAGLAAGSGLVLYALAPGAFVELATELGHALGAEDGEMLLDRDLHPDTRSGIVGVEELAMINRAIGVLIGRGRTADEARAYLRLKAAQANLRPYQVAAYLVSLTE